MLKKREKCWFSALFAPFFSLEFHFTDCWYLHTEQHRIVQCVFVLRLAVERSDHNEILDLNLSLDPS